MRAGVSYNGINPTKGVETSLFSTLNNKKTMKDSEDFEKALMTKLTSRQNDKEFLRKTSSAIVSLKKQGFVIDKILTKGQPVLDRVYVMGKPHPDFQIGFRDFGNLGSSLSRFEIFPYGVIAIDGFNFKATFGH